MKNADMPAMPQSATDSGYGCNYIEDYNGQVPTGLTKREMFAMHAMQAMLSSKYVADYNGGSLPYENNEICKRAVHYADALLGELEK